MRQIISIDPADITASPNGEVSFDVIYNVEPIDDTLTGIGLRLHFNSDDLTFGELSNIFSTSLTGQQTLPDTDNFDNDETTDSFILTGWLDIFNAAWPGNGNLPDTTLYTANFTAAEDFESTTINFTASTVAAGYELDAESITIEKTDLPPVVANAIADVSFPEDSEVQTIDLSNVFNDPDDENAAITKAIQSNSNSDLVTAAIDGNNLTLTFAENQSGVADITVRGTSDGQTEDDTFRVTVTPDLPPVVANAIADVSFPEDSAVQTIDLSNVFNDPDDENAAITKAIQSNSNSDLVTAAIDGNNLTLTFAENQSGVANITVRGTSDGQTEDDTFRVTVTSVDDPIVENSGIFTTDEMSNYLFKLLDSSSDLGSVNEVGIFNVDDASGSIEGVSPEDDSYLEAVLGRSQTLFSVLANFPPQFAGNLESVLGFEANSNFGFYLLPNSTTEMAKTKLAAGEDLEIFLSTGENLNIEEAADTPGLFNLSWEESALGGDNSGDFDDLSLSIQATDRSPSLAKDAAHPEILDLSNAAPTSNVGENNIDYTVTLTREADFDSSVALYEIQDFDGTIVDPVSGETIAATAENRTEYMTAAKALAINPLGVGDEEINTSAPMQIEVGKLYAPILLMEVENFDEVYTPFMTVNTEGMDRVRSLGDNIIGFEDNIDNDYNDLVVEFNFL